VALSGRFTEETPAVKGKSLHLRYLFGGQAKIYACRAFQNVLRTDQVYRFDRQLNFCVIGERKRFHRLQHSIMISCLDRLSHGGIPSTPVCLFAGM
jgi:hypothetical protein